MKKFFYFLICVLMLSFAFSACSEKDDDIQPEPWWHVDDLRTVADGFHKEGSFVGTFKVEFTDSDVVVGECKMSSYMGFDMNVPSEYVIPRVMKTDSTYTLDEGQYWTQSFRIPLKGKVDSTYTFKVIDQFPEISRQSLVSGWCGKYMWFFTASYDDSEASYNAETDTWEGTIRINNICVYNSIGQILHDGKNDTPLTLRFHSTERIKDR